MGTGQITNLQSNDTSKLYNIPQYLHMIWSGPMQVRSVRASSFLLMARLQEG
jgi:hypothetical protein